ncbi:IS1634 family transposase [Acetivibrio ethanolgignens]|uniref:Transposase n=1 Tax=Acetivibrio ethanolgignens TaxID=290052 RepID=A0A0V8QEE1_9FIRM|nr:IS1634 family transposase [Acetivibrio ethanolgignens]KSV58952.1 transposase [Acetivibrio ethanolgignens]
MAYFLKKTNNKKGTYLQIYSSFYDPERGHTAHKAYKPVGYVHELQAKGIDDPIAFYKEEVIKLNQELKAAKDAKKNKQISDDSPEKLIGYFPMKNINDKLSVKKYIDLMQTATDFRFNVFDMMSALVYARLVHPCSKSKTYDEVIPKLFDSYVFSLNQLYNGLEYIGCEYEKIIEIYNHQIQQMYKFDTSHSYFDCTNFYFEIDKEDDFRKKGPSKENKKEPIVGLGLLLDANQIPIGMKLFPGNQSEKPIIRNIIHDLKKRNSISGRTIQIADKGLNCAENIYHALKNGDGYIFSKSVKMLPEVEKTWVLLPNDYRDVKNANGDVLYRIKECVDDFEYKFNDSETGKEKKFKITEKRIVTYNPKLAKKQIYEINKEVEKARLLKASQAKKSEYGDSAKYVIFTTADKKGNETEGKIKVSMNEKLIKKSLDLAGYNMLVTSEISMSDKDVYDAYHNLWRIEESFRIMKSQLYARPVYLHKEDTIIGHFLICYLAVLLTRLLQFKILKNNYCSEDLFEFVHDFRVAKISDRKYINLLRGTTFIKEFSSLCNLPLTSYFLSEGEIKKMLSHRF